MGLLDVKNARPKCGLIESEFAWLVLRTATSAGPKGARSALKDGRGMAQLVLPAQRPNI